MTPSEIFRAAAAILRRDGWCQGVGVNSLGQRCAGAAIDRASMGTRVCPAASESTMDHVYGILGQLLEGSLPNWNDKPERTVEEVLALLERAAEVGEPEKRRILIPVEAPLTPESPLWTDPAPEEPKRIPDKVPA